MLQKKQLIMAISVALSMATTHANAENQNTQKAGVTFNGEVGDLAQGCYAIESPRTGKSISGFEHAGAVNDGLSYIFNNNAPSKFYLKPTSLDGKFMLRDVNERYFGTHLPLQISAGKTAGEFVEWKITKAGNDTYKLKAVKLDRDLKHSRWRNGKLLLNKWAFFTEEAFNLVSQTGCTDFPEVSLNVTGDRELLKGDVNQPVRGYIDPHTHITSYEFMGGKFMAGEPFNKWGVEEALKDDKASHGPEGSLDIIGNLYVSGDLNARHNTSGWPNFTDWPNYQSLSHMGYYYKWLERAHLSGLRMTVTNIVENEVLCNLQSTINPAAWVGANSCNTMDSIYKQIDSLNNLQDYVDAQAGGKGKGFFRIVKTPQEAREVIANGQLAVVMGIEASETFNCGNKDKDCTKDNIETELNALHDLGVRSIFPVHKFDNKFGGSPVESGFINVGQWVSAGKFFETEQCDGETYGMTMESGFPLVGNLPFLKDVFNAIKLNPQYEEGAVSCNKEGLTDLGSYLVNRMIDKKMMVEMDHMSVKTANAVLDIASNREFGGLITSHSWMRKAKDGRLDHYNTKRLLQLGGFAGAYNVETYAMADAINDYLTVVEDTPYLNAVGLSTDMSGLGEQPGPRADAAEKPLQYPYTTEFGTTFDKQVSGNKEFDINTDGVAHYGLVSDHVQDLRERTDTRIYESIMNSAEAYLQMWERTEATADTEHYNPL